MYVEQALQETSTDTSSIIKNPTPIIKVDKCIDNVPKVKSVRTQYNVSHFYKDKPPPIVKRDPIRIKLPTPKKTRDIGVNTYV